MTYTSNWPHEPLINNRPTGDAVVWTGVSIIVLLAGIGGMAWWHASRKEEDPLGEIPADDPLLRSKPTPSQRAVVKYFWIVCGLILVQILMGVITAHYGVEGNGFYGIPLASMAAVQRDAHLARAARPVLDRDRVAGGGPLHRARR